MSRDSIEQTARTWKFQCPCGQRLTFAPKGTRYYLALVDGACPCGQRHSRPVAPVAQRERHAAIVRQLRADRPTKAQYERHWLRLVIGEFLLRRCREARAVSGYLNRGREWSL